MSRDRVVARAAGSGAASRVRALGASAALAVVVALGLAPLGSDGARTVGASEAVQAAELACPAPVQSGAGAKSVLTLAVPAPELTMPGVGQPTDATAPDASSVPAPDSAALAAFADLSATGRARAQRSGTGALDLDVSAIGTAQLARATGSSAPGLAAGLLTQVGSGPGRGLAAVACTRPGAASYFVGAGTDAGRRDRLVLANPEVSDALVDLSFWNAGGPLAPPNSRDVQVPARSVVSIPLDGIVAGHPRLAVSVAATRGRVAAFVHDLDAPGITARGIDWIAATPSPTRTVVIPGLPAGELDRKLTILVPGERDAIASVVLQTAQGAFAPAGIDVLELPAGRLAEFDLDSAVAGQAASVVITADRPVVAAVRLVRSTRAKGPRIADVAYATAARALTAPAVVADGLGPPAYATRLMFTATRADAQVLVHVVARNGAVSTREVRVGAGRSVVVDPAPMGVRRYVVIVVPAPGSAPVYAARILRAGAGDLTVSTLISGRYGVVLPALVADLRAVIDP
ncbi:MAG: DUF5719 family protein [Sporichthyaceae bacterium]